jgi:hypothetical protein
MVGNGLAVIDTGALASHVKHVEDLIDVPQPSSTLQKPTKNSTKSFAFLIS